jgi:hypothetical protein
MATTYFDCRYLTLVGHVQSGKTQEEINYTYQSIKNGFPVIFIVRNITADQLQLVARIHEFNKTVKNSLNVKILSHASVEEIANSMELKSVTILLCNNTQLRKMRNVLKIYQGGYHVVIDEVDFSIKSKSPDSSETEFFLRQIKSGANHILGATATPVAVFTTEKNVDKIVKLKPGKNYRGIESLNIEFVDNFVTNDPRSDTATINKIYNTLLNKTKAVLLHNVTRKRKNHNLLLNFICGLFPTITYIVYNGDGIKVVCKNRESIAFTNPRGINCYGQNILRYHLLPDFHFFENYSISEVLQLLVDDPFYKHTHISIISGNLASRGVSFVSSDYSLHLTDQYFNPGTQTHGESYLQSLRILGCYRETTPLTLWCSERTWNRIVQHNDIINNLVNNVHNESQWLSKIKNVMVSKPDNPLTRPKLMVPFKKINNQHFSLAIEEELI